MSLRTYSGRFGMTPSEATSPSRSATATAIVSACTSRPTNRVTLRMTDSLSHVALRHGSPDSQRNPRPANRSRSFHPDFLHRELLLSKAAAQYRKVAAELIQQVPAVVEPLRDGRLCLTSIIEAAKVVTAENWETVLPRFFGLSRREAMEVVA